MNNYDDLTPNEMRLHVLNCFEIIKCAHEIHLKYKNRTAKEYISVKSKTYDLGSYGCYSCTTTDWSFNITKIKNGLYGEEQLDIINLSTVRDISSYKFVSSYSEHQERFSYNFMYRRPADTDKDSIYVISGDDTHKLKFIDKSEIESFLFQCSTVMSNEDAIHYVLANLLYEEQLPYINMVLNTNIIFNSHLNLNLKKLKEKI